MSVTPKIATKFTVDGLRQSAAGFTRFGVQARGVIQGVKAKAAEALKPMEKDIARAKRSLHGLQVASLKVGTVGFAGLSRSARFAFREIKVGAIAAAASVTAVSVAAVKAAKDSATEVEKIRMDSARLGVSVGDLSVLNFASEREGVNPEEVTKGIAKIGSEFQKVRQKIAEANGEFSRMLDLSRQDAGFALVNRDGQALQKVADGVASARTSSFAGIQDRIGFLQNDIAQRDVYRANPLTGQAALRDQQILQARRKELSELLKAQEDLKKSFGPMGEALFGLEQYGLDVDKTSRGGVEGLLALGDAIRNVQDPTERLRYSVQLFGEDAGPKLLNLLMSGREGMQAYRKEAERLGLVVNEADAKMAEAHEAASINFKKSLTGLKMAVGRELLPTMTETSNAMTEWVVSNRGRIAGLVKDGVTAVKNLFADVTALYNGKRSGFQTEWLNGLMERIKFAKRLVENFRGEIEKAASGNSSYGWLNQIVAGLQKAREFAQDLWTVLKGGDAQKFEWLNRLRDGVVEFATAFKAAFDAFMATLGFIRDNFVKPIADFLGTDPLTMAMFLGFARFTGLLGIATKSVGLLFKAVTGLFGLSGMGLAASVAGIGTQAGGAAGAVKTLGATVVGMLGRVSAAAGLILAGWEAGEYLGQKVSDWTGRTERLKNTEDMAAERARILGDAAFWEQYRSWGRTGQLDRQKDYWTANRGIYYDDKPAGSQIAAFMGIKPEDMANMQDMQGNAIRFNGRPEQTIALKIDLNGKSATVTGQPGSGIESVIAEANRLNRMQGGY